MTKQSNRRRLARKKIKKHAIKPTQNIDAPRSPIPCDTNDGLSLGAVDKSTIIDLLGGVLYRVLVEIIFCSYGLTI
jgi:hypothetical protein